jgi:hypothetical protein
MLASSPGSYWGHHSGSINTSWRPRLPGSVVSWLVAKGPRRKPIHSRSPTIGETIGRRHTIARMGDADRVVEPGPDKGDKDNGNRAGARRPEVAALVARLRDGVDGLRALPLEGVPPALGDRLWP